MSKKRTSRDFVDPLLQRGCQEPHTEFVSASVSMTTNPAHSKHFDK